MADQLTARRIGERIRGAREAAGLSQLELASRVGRAQSTLSFWETGAREINVSDLIRLADEMNVPPATLLRGSQDGQVSEHG